ncbi:MAG TPA: SDR family NAD(P)-dependent oxidoreductase [Vicinamibacteria bacterium]|nr:SDR family NAD(P)-dependent oxidoreductase [Vicinamibacteria bacterium]
MAAQGKPVEIPSVASLLDFRGKVAIVTGAAQGLGRGIAARFAEAGAAVVVHYRGHAEEAEAVARHITGLGGAALAVAADLTRAEDAARLVARTVEGFGRLDVLVNNAGAYPMAALLDMTAAQWDEVLDANLRTAFLCTQAAGRQMVGQGSGGAIVNVTSIEAEHPAPGHSHYNAAKAGLLQHTRAAAQELAAHGIRVNAVAPGLIRREGIDEAWPDGVERWQRAAPLHRLGRPEDVADACLFLASAGARWITGVSLTVDGGVTIRPAF